MGDVCTGAPTFTSFSASTEQTFSVFTSTSQSLSIVDPSTINRAITISGTDIIATESIIPGATVTVDIPVEVTITAQRVISVPVLTLYAPCSSSETTPSSIPPTSTPEPSTTSTSTAIQTTPTSESRTDTSTTRTSGSTSATPPASSSSDRQNPQPTSTPPPTSSGSSNNNNNGQNNASETGTIITTTSAGLTTLPNGVKSTYIATLTTSIPPNGSLNDNHNGGSGGGASTRAIAIGVGVAGGVLALIILMVGITWHIRRKRRTKLEDDDIWAPDREQKSPRAAVIPEYSYNPYGEGRTTSYAPVPTASSPPRSRPLSLGSGTPRASVSSTNALGGLAPAPPMSRTKTADEILYEAAREGLPHSRTASVATRGYGSLTASSHMTHNTSYMTHTGRSDSVVGLLESHGASSEPPHQAEDDRPASPVSIAAPKLAITNPDADRD